MRFSPHFLDEIRGRLSVSQVVSRSVSLKKKGREWVGLSPFKTEKTPSFYVNDQKGFYHCFASGEHGDIFTFLMKTEGLQFPEAVERLAQDAGVPMPKPDVREEAREDERQRHYRLLEIAAAFFEESLAGGFGVEARRYLDKRGVRRETRAKFRLGYAPNSRSAMKEHLAKAGFTVPEMILTGMLIGGDDIPTPYDRFRDRVMFPIADMKGRIIAFGGRALDANAPAKYLNSPETPLFHKGHNLYNGHQARGASHSKGRIVVVEGYMDVVALSEAGFNEAVAPLGTALTEPQVQLLWRMANEPILCFDGDSAGRKAAHRAVDTALPLLKPGTSLSFAFLPDGLDPDDLVRQQGAAAIEHVFARAKPLVEVLFEREWAAGDWSTPERRARLEQQIRELTGKIGDQGVRGHYERDLRGRLWAAWGGRQGSDVGRFKPEQGRRAGQGGSRWQPPGGAGKRGGAGRNPQALPQQRANASASLKNSRLVAAGGAEPPYREALLVAAMMNHPELIEEHAEEVAGLAFSSPALTKLRDALLSLQAHENFLDTATLRTQLSKLGVGGIVDLVDRSITHRCDKFAEPNSDRAEVDAGWRHALGLHERQSGLRRSLEVAERAWHEDRSEEAFARICEIKRQLEHMSADDQQGFEESRRA
ncbi:MAG: DNA primase [Hyphomicrobiaceae bacterium]|nr:DNA primase [Hyphomicrobiaceae bacterium]